MQYIFPQIFDLGETGEGGYLSPLIKVKMCTFSTSLLGEHDGMASLENTNILQASDSKMREITRLDKKRHSQNSTWHSEYLKCVAKYINKCNYESIKCLDIFFRENTQFLTWLRKEEHLLIFKQMFNLSAEQMFINTKESMILVSVMLLGETNN